MSCVSPPAPDDVRLLAYLDGELDRDLAAHLARCPACRARARRLARQAQRLSVALYRADCPTAQLLGEYHLGLLARGQAAAIARHLAGCPHCRRELAQLAGFLGDLAPEPQTGMSGQAAAAVKVLVARLISGLDTALGQGPVFNPALATVRGDEPCPCIYAAGDAQVTLDVTDSAGQPGHRSLLGLLAGAGTGPFEVLLWQAGQLVANVPVDELANFVVADLLPGAYELVLRGPGLTIYIQDLRV